MEGFAIGVVCMIAANAGLPFIGGISAVIRFIGSKHNKAVKAISYIIASLLAVFLFLTIWFAEELLCLIPNKVLGDYIAAILYCLLLMALGGSALYKIPTGDKSSIKAIFIEEYTYYALKNPFTWIPYRLIIYVFYFVILILSQLYELDVIEMNNDWAYFCSINKYGIVIMLSVERIIKAILSLKDRFLTLKNAKTHVDQRTDREDAEYEQSKKEFKELLHMLKDERKQAKQKAHLLKQGKQEDEVQI